MFEDSFLPLAPINFFEIAVSVFKLNPAHWKEEIIKKKSQLPDTAWLLGEKSRLDLHVGWSEEGLYFYAHIDGRFDQPNFPALTEGDSLELFIDTRDRKNSGFNTKFCHHFYFLPQAVDGHMKGEITRFRNEDAHPLAEADDIHLEAFASSHEGKLKIFLPAVTLVGWNPQEFDRFGFTYRLNRRWQEATHFSAKTSEYAIEQEPSLWASCKLT